MSAATVTLGVPVYEGAGVVAATLQSLQAQTDPDLRVLIAVDLSTDGSEAVCREFLVDPRFQVAAHARRLGWVGNVNWLLAHIETPLFCLIPHDDLLDPSCVARLRAALDAHPEAVVAYCDIRCFGDLGEFPFVEPAIHGPPLARLLTYVVGHHLAVPFRGMVRTAAAHLAGPLRGNPFGDYAADTVWLARLLRHGDFVRVPEPLYAKRFRAGAGAQLAWPMADPAWQRAAWAQHCLDLAEAVLTDDLPEPDRALLLHALVFRLLWSPRLMRHFAGLSELPEAELRAQRDEFVGRLGGLVGAAGLAPLAYSK